MNAKTIWKALCIKAKQRSIFGKSIAKSYVSLFLVLILGFTTTMAWFTERQASKLQANALEFQSASSLRINKDQSSGNKITIPAFTLDEASSIDGRNIYFPLDKSFHSKTAEMFFREGNMGDENVHYVYKDFELEGTSGNTPVYIKSYKIQVGNDVFEDELKVENDSDGKPLKQVKPSDHCPVRLAFIADSGVNPVVIDPSAQVVDYVDNTQTDTPSTGGAVALIDENGVPTLESSYPNHNWNAFSTYYYEHTPLFVIPGGKKLNVTLVVWIEGTLEDLDPYIGKEISVDIDIESNFAEMDTITFVDGTYGDTVANARYWITNPDDYGLEPIIACSYEDPYSTEETKRWKTVIMRKTKEKEDGVSGAEWQAEIPKKAVTNISFYRLTRHNGSDQATIYNAWHTRENVMTMVNTDIPNDWYKNGDNVGKTNAPLQDSRQYFDTFTNTNDNSLIYTAVHGNNYSTTSAENERLSPCIGYWGFEPGTGSGSTGGGGQQSGGGGGDTSSTCEVDVILRVNNGFEWVYNSPSSCIVGFETESGLDCDFGGSSSWSDKSTTKRFTLPYGDKILRFYKRDSANGNKQYQHFNSTASFKVPSQASYTVTYELDNQKNWKHN